MKPVGKSVLCYATCLTLLLTWTMLESKPLAAQVFPSGWEFGPLFEWADINGGGGARILLPRLMHGELLKDNLSPTQEDFKDDFGITAPDCFWEFWVAVHCNRMTLRYHFEPDRTFRGYVEGSGPGDPGESELDLGTNRIGLDFDLLRYPSFVAGINFDYHLNRVKFVDHRFRFIVPWPPFIYDTFIYQEGRPVTVGLHARIAPVLMKYIPVKIQARSRFPVNSVKLTDWEIAAAIKPTNLPVRILGNWSLDIDFNIGFRSVKLDLGGDELTVGSTETMFVTFKGPWWAWRLRSQWQGVFFGLTMSY